MSEEQKKTLSSTDSSSANCKKDDACDSKEVPYVPYINEDLDEDCINEDFDEDCEDDVNSNKNKEKKSKEITVKEFTDYFNKSLLNEEEDEEEEVELRDYTAGDKDNEPFSDEEECEIKGYVKTLSESVEEEENENVNTCCGQDISKIENQQEIEQNTEDVNIPAKIREFQPTKEDITRKETMLIEKNTANANDESFVTFKPEPAEQKKEKSDDEEKPEITLDGINHNLSESEFSFRIGKKQDKKCDAEVEVGENHKSDYKKKFKDRLTLNRKIKVDKLYLYPLVGNTTWNSYDKVLSKFCKKSPKEIEVSIPKGGSFQISGFKVMNNKKKNNGANVTKTCIDGKKITFICK